VGFHALCLAVLVSVVAVQQRDAPADARPTRLGGRVLAADTGKPLPGALVHVVDLRAANPVQRQGRWVTTNADGRWELMALAPGRYTVIASKSGYLRLEYGQQRPFERGKILELAAGQSHDIALALPRAGAITGRIFDEFGDPMTAVLVRAMRYRYVDGQRQLIPLVEGLEVLTNGGGDITDDLGQFRIYGLTPGEYYVSAVFAPPGESATRGGYPPVYYPGTVSVAQARAIAVRIGEEAQNISFNLVTAPYAVVSGTIVNSAGSTVKGSVNLHAAEAIAVPLPSTATTAADGAFALSNVPPGDYRLQVWGVQGPGGVPEFASMPVTVAGQDLTGLVITTLPGATATGRVVFEEGARPDARLFVRAVTTVAGAPTFANTAVGVQGDMTFELRGLSERQTFRLGLLPEGWYLKSVMHDAVDITDSGYDFKPGQHASRVEIQLTRRATTLTGSVQDAQGTAVGDYTVVAFAADSAKWGYQTRFVRSVRPDQQGRFSIRALPPGDYLVVALEYVETGQEFDPEQLARWKPLGVPITLGEGEAKAVTLKLSR
jgi:5-hydroxyisourate hydrolase-like protein (transthyretin family)